MENQVKVEVNSTFFTTGGGGKLPVGSVASTAAAKWRAPIWVPLTSDHSEFDICAEGGDGSIASLIKLVASLLGEGVAGDCAER